MHKSIIQNLAVKKCYICGREGIVEQHHCIHGTSNRKRSDSDGLIVNLCVPCHRYLHDKGDFDGKIKENAQIVWMRYNLASEEEFIARYGRSYL